MKRNIAIIDYGINNISSLQKALKKIDSRGNVIENLNRDEYLEVYTPLICKSKYIEN